MGPAASRLPTPSCLSNCASHRLCHLLSKGCPGQPRPGQEAGQGGDHHAMLKGSGLRRGLGSHATHGGAVVRQGWLQVAGLRGWL